MTQAILNTAQVLRQIVIGTLGQISETGMDTQPEGFNNTIRWNVGHIVYWMDKYSTLSFNSPPQLPELYEAYFNSGTKPSNWVEAPPSKEELMEQLSAQFARLSPLTPELLNTKLQSPFELGPFKFHTSGELFNFALMHEAIHLGVISSQLKLV
ncbi:DinB family protein [Paenibacillus sp. GCM10027627]|uniref:DinB family protein n=1 Tax=unclassified Paenibacillus TaxID=185978 RepID=UPI003625FC21